MRAILDVDHFWEEHFDLKCDQLRSPLARFALYRYVRCKYLLPHVFEPNVSLQYTVTLSIQPRVAASFASQTFRQFFIARERLDKYFPEDDAPSAHFCWLPPVPDEGVPRCQGLCHVGDIPIRIIEQAPSVIVRGKLFQLAQRMDEERELESDDSFDCSECGEENHDWDNWM
jgi:hypothetical protein